MVIIIAVFIALLFAMNIGGSGAAASMGIVYGTGAIRSKRRTLIICSIAIFLGAAFGSRKVIETVGTGLIDVQLLNATSVVIILGSACTSLFIANMIGIPLSTSEVTVGAVIGLGFVYKSIYVESVLYIVLWWMITPLLAFLIVYGAILFYKKVRIKFPQPFRIKKQYIVLFVIIAGFLEALAAGMNNVANAVGPLVGAAMIPSSIAMGVGGLFIAIGAIVFGGKVLDTNGKKITKISIHDGLIVSLTSACITIIASICGIPIPMTQVTTSAIVGVGVANEGKVIFQQPIFKRIMIVWVVSPLISFFIAYYMVQIFVEQDMLSILLMTVFLLFVVTVWKMRTSIWKKEINKRSV